MRRETRRARNAQAAHALDVYVAVVLVNYQTPELTEKCLASLRQECESFRKFQVVVVDGGSGDNSKDKLSAAIEASRYRSWVRLLPLELNGGFGWANNQAIRSLMDDSSPPDFIHFLNPDTQIEPRAVSALAEYLEHHPRVGAVGSQLTQQEGLHTGSAFSFPTIRGEFARGVRTRIFDRLLRVPPIKITCENAAEVEWVTGASVMFRSKVLQQVGLFDEGFFLYHEELELMWRLRRAGWSIVSEPLSRVHHIGGAATGVRSSARPTELVARTPRYWYRSRARMFALTRGRTIAILAFTAWLMGHIAWRIRRGLGLARGTKLTDHELRDHFRLAFPRALDGQPAVADLGTMPDALPAWMSKGTL